MSALPSRLIPSSTFPHYKQSDYGKVILPLTVLRRLDYVLEPTEAAVLAEIGNSRGYV